MSDTEVTITTKVNGPYIVKGNVKLLDADGNEIKVEREVIALCRCGESSKKPFCDGAHRTSRCFNPLTQDAQNSQNLPLK